MPLDQHIWVIFSLRDLTSGKHRKLNPFWSGFVSSWFLSWWLARSGRFLASKTSLFEIICCERISWTREGPVWIFRFSGTRAKRYTCTVYIEHYCRWGDLPDEDRWRFKRASEFQVDSTTSTARVILIIFTTLSQPIQTCPWSATPTNQKHGRYKHI